ncbi:unnamed protein product [Schistosoma mattheei]|uniref:Uncharacterized protein n=1 Tax=Schistosoma mattheei TaxID=31246 RepID=A0A183NPL1_9TREM|nr:unnamed protein product [Schistosoma mattheei]
MERFHQLVNIVFHVKILVDYHFDLRYEWLYFVLCNVQPCQSKQ